MSNNQVPATQGSILLRSNWFFLFIAASLLAVFSFILPRQLPLFFSLDHKYADIRTTFASPKKREQFQGFFFVKITESDLREMPYRSPIDRAWLANLIEEIDSRNPSVIGVNILIDQPTETEKDQKLIDVLKAAKSNIVFSKVDKGLSLTPFQKEYSDWFFQQTGVHYGIANIPADQDDVIRQLPQTTAQSSELSFADTVASMVSNSPIPLTSKNEQIAWLRDVSKQKPAFQEQHASFVRDRPDKVDLEGKVVLIGQDIPSLDRHKTPFNSWGDIDSGMAGSRINGQIIVQRMEGRRLRFIPSVFEFLLYFLSAILGLRLASRLLELKYPNLLFLCLNVVFVLLDVFTFKVFSVVAPTAMMLLTFALSFKLPATIAIISHVYREFKTNGFSK